MAVKAWPLSRINRIQRVIPFHTPLAKLGRAIAASVWHQKLRARQARATLQDVTNNKYYGSN